MTGIGLRALLSEARTFFKGFETEIKEQLEIFEAEKARADSAVVSEWIDRVYLENIRHTVEKLDTFYELTIDDQEAKQDAILNKTKDFLLRAKEALEDAVASTKASATYIPVPAHKQFAANAEKLLGNVNELLSGERLPQTDKAQKTWYNNVLHKAVAFIKIRTESFGLGKPDHDRNAALNLKHLAETLSLADSASLSSEVTVTVTVTVPVALAITKTTIKQDEDQKKYIPATLDFCLQRFKALQDSGDTLSKKAVMDVMTPEFPNPRAQL